MPEPTTTNNLKVPPATAITTSSGSTITTRTPMTTSADLPSPTTNEKNVESAARSRTIGIFIWVVVGLVAILGLSLLSIYLMRRWRRYQERHFLSPRYHAVHSRENSQPEEMKELLKNIYSQHDPLCIPLTVTHCALTYHASVPSLRATLVLYCNCRLRWNRLPFILHTKREMCQRETLGPHLLNGITRRSGK
ncbi:hypothetical protein DFS33DRAFT_330800 [Desarmillaria ectypa]|nr:hypothetical protein DFS33DRAFT_330800 [Desarmillaria ectypa]